MIFDNVPKDIVIFHVVFIGLFATVALVVLTYFISAFISDKHAKKYYFSQWKLTRGTLKERKKANIPTDPYLGALHKKTVKICNCIISVYIILTVILVILILIL